ncbi:MAG: FAD-dependent oxidoreductase [Pseudomonadota bacterium]
MSDHYDVVVIGGGIHGVGVAQAAACDGYTVLLLEQHSLASGTSSRSSKLIHGGLRYLEGYDFGLVHESLAERTILLNIAPELVRLQPFHIPVYPDTSRRPLTLRAGLTLYALLSGLNRTSRFRKLAKHEWGALDGLDTRKLQAVFQYFDAQTNDAELTRAVMQSAIEFGATLSCPSEFLSATIGQYGCEILYRENAHEKSCSASIVVNAGGPWVNTITERISPTPARIAVDLVQGTHLILEGSLEKGCYYMEAPQDQRAIFLLPWGKQTMLGTTENLYSGDPADVAPLPQEIDYLLEVMQHYFPDRTQDVADMFAGLRVLPASNSTAFKRSRETQLPVNNSTHPRVVSIVGGKLTGYRAAAQKVMKLLQRTLPARTSRADTSALFLKPVP